jgi:hypothetical protein
MLVGVKAFTGQIAPTPGGDPGILALNRAVNRILMARQWNGN